MMWKNIDNQNLNVNFQDLHNYIDYLLSILAMNCLYTSNDSFNRYLKLYILMVFTTDILSRILFYIYDIKCEQLYIVLLYTKNDLVFYVKENEYLNNIYNWLLYCIFIASFKCIFEIYSTLVVLFGCEIIVNSGYNGLLVLLIWTYRIYKVIYIRNNI
jgi:hypothetical protein